MTPNMYLRRIDEQPVEAVRYTGCSLAEIRAFIGAGYRVTVSESNRRTLRR